MIRSRRINTASSLFAVLLLAALGVWSSAWSGDNAVKQTKKYPHPHQIHMEAKSESSAEFSADEIGDWQGFMRSLQGKGRNLPLDSKDKMIISYLNQDDMSSDDKGLVINIMNKLLVEKGVASHGQGIWQISSETKKMDAVYKKTKENADLKWLNRSLLCDIFPQVKRKKRTGELKNITCATCHEAQGPRAWGKLDPTGQQSPVEEAVSESGVMECISKAIAGERTMEECVDMVKAVRKSVIEPYGPLKNFIRKTDAKGELPLLAAVHPEDPVYAFKPLLKRLVCLECHSRARKVDWVMGSDGKPKKIKIFFGAGSDAKQ